MVASDVLMAYPNPNIQFHIDTKALDYQMEATIIQQKCPVAYRSCKWTKTQRNNQQWRKNFSQSSWSLKSLTPFSWWRTLRIHWSQKLTFVSLNYCHVFCCCTLWRSMVLLIYISMKKCHWWSICLSPTARCVSTPERQNAPVVLFDFINNSLDVSNNPELLECLLNFPVPKLRANSTVDLSWIYEQQNIGNEHTTKPANILIDTLIKPTMVTELCTALSPMKIASHNVKSLSPR